MVINKTDFANNVLDGAALKVWAKVHLMLWARRQEWVSVSEVIKETNRVILVCVDRMETQSPQQLCSQDWSQAGQIANKHKVYWLIILLTIQALLHFPVLLSYLSSELWLQRDTIWTRIMTLISANLWYCQPPPIASRDPVMNNY